MCSPSQLDLCDAEQTAAIQKFQAMPDDELNDYILGKLTNIEKIEETFQAQVEELQQKYEELVAKKDADINEIKKGGLGMAKAVLTTKTAATGKDEL